MKGFHSNNNDRKLNFKIGNDNNNSKRVSAEKDLSKGLYIVKEGSLDNLDEEKMTIEDENLRNVSNSINPKLMNSLENKNK